MVKPRAIGLDGRPITEAVERPITPAEMLANFPETDMVDFDALPPWVRRSLANARFPLKAKDIRPHIHSGMVHMLNWNENFRINQNRQREAVRQKDIADGLVIR